MKMIKNCLTDLHVHSRFSYDSDEETEKYVEKAVALGEGRIGFVQHYDYDRFLLDRDAPLCDIDAYYREIKRLREKYEGRIGILFGIEFGYDERAVAQYRSLTEKYPFDYVINSVHLVGGVDCCLEECWKNRSIGEVYREYLERVQASLHAEYPWQIVGHLGYPTRYARLAGAESVSAQNLFFENYPQAFTEILETVISEGKWLEINSSTKTENLFLPSLKMAERYAALGGRYVTFGSDAHTVTRYAQNKTEAAALIEKYGFTPVG